MLVPLVITTSNVEAPHCFAITEVAFEDPVILVKPTQSEKACSPMLVTLSGIVTLVKPLQPEKA